MRSLIDIKRNGSRPATKGSPDWFTGSVPTAAQRPPANRPYPPRAQPPRAANKSMKTHQIASEGAQVGQFERIVGRNNELEMMPIISATLSESTRPAVVRAAAEHARRLAFFGITPSRRRYR